MANARPSWSGVLKIGTITIPVQLVPACGDEESPFVTVHAVDDGRLETLRRCKTCARDVAADECVQAVEVSKGVYSKVTPADLEPLATPARETVDLFYFPELGSISPALYEKPYYVRAADPGDQVLDNFAVALRQDERIAIGKIAFRSRERLFGVYWGADGLCGSTMRFPTEIRANEQFSLHYAQPTVDGFRKLFAVEKPLDPLTGFPPCRDEYTARLDVFLTRKRAGRSTATTIDALETELKRSAAKARRQTSRKAAA